jgi:hypothetical protein
MIILKNKNKIKISYLLNVYINTKEKKKQKPTIYIFETYKICGNKQQKQYFLTLSHAQIDHHSFSQ